MDKRVANAEAVIGRVKEGATILMGAFGTCGVPENLINALIRQGTKNLTVASNNPGIDGYGIGALLENRQVKKLIASYVGSNKFFEKLALNNEIQMELNPQGTLAERMLDIRKGSITAQRHSDKIKTFDEWQSSSLAQS